MIIYFFSKWKINIVNCINGSLLIFKSGKEYTIVNRINGNLLFFLDGKKTFWDESKRNVCNFFTEEVN